MGQLDNAGRHCARILIFKRVVVCRFQFLILGLARILTRVTARLLLRGIRATPHRLLQNANNVEIFMVQQDTLLFEVMRDYALLLADRLGAPVDLLK